MERTHSNVGKRSVQIPALHLSAFWGLEKVTYLSKSQILYQVSVFSPVNLWCFYLPPRLWEGLNTMCKNLVHNWHSGSTGCHPYPSRSLLHIPAPLTWPSSSVLGKFKLDRMLFQKSSKNKHAVIVAIGKDHWIHIIFLNNLIISFKM